MLAEIAQILLLVTAVILGTFSAISLASFGGIIPSLQGVTRQMLRPAAYGQWFLMMTSFVILISLFIGHDYSISYVASNSNSMLPWYYQISAVWGGHEGSLLLWVTILATWYALVVRFSETLPEELLCLVAGVLAGVQTGFLAFILVTSDPFASLPLPTPMDGNDLNPLLQDIGLILHPPLLYMGYVGMSVAFAFAIAGLIHGGIGSAWARWTRPWTLYAWAFLTVGIALGSWWAYYELGWGGWWFWDPVENASLMPWLAATGLIHSLAVTDKRGVLKAWTLFLAILAFSLSLLGTFLVRSGVLTSVHAFAADPSRGIFILGLLGVVIGGSLLLFGFRAHLVESKVGIRLASRETGLLVNNILLCTATFIILMGTLYPLFEEMMGLTQSSVGAPYFNAMFTPLSLAMLALLAVGPRLNWKRHEGKAALKMLSIALIAGAVIGAAVWFMTGWHLMMIVTFILVAAVVWSIGTDIRHQIRNASSMLAGLSRLKPHYWGMHIAHTGLAVMVIGVVCVSYLSTEEDMLMTVGESYSVGDYQVTLEAVNDIHGPNYRSSQGVVTFELNGQSTTLKPEKRFYIAREAIMTEVAMDVGLFGDLYVALGDARNDTQWTVRVHDKPMIRWVWGGALLIAFGGVWASFDRRYRANKELKQGAAA
ncbi:MAG: heme lyase NrfEFG subunit NrfE [Gammaproteobacteria bacterium]|nr:heme lyase NrfEFG subunit NrfE [Gammaproteobacteria bacterium]|tara:strand:+ start:881 stop:2842 length:1962 start_codon:yes stop_codon:yes gene_type:complete